ncbi:MAG: hypothetical protein EAZ53_03640 [Bacteroidetes bacterium]|nr:MAG: hypothetical protein EAZ53_03640 [Bacteroidota bacterium]
METFIVKTKNKAASIQAKKVLEALNAQVVVLKNLEDFTLGKMMEEAENEGYLSTQEKENLLQSMRKK